MLHLAAVVAATCTLAWHAVPSPPLWGAQLHAVAATAADDAWAVGGPAPRGGRAQPVVEHWNGTHWRIAAVPAAGAALRAVAAIARNDVWAVGGDLLEHWNGVGWHRFSAPAVTGLSAVSATGRDDVWAVGSNVIVHWDGARWRQRLRAVGLTDVTALTADDVWAVGVSGARFFELHWNGRRWSRYVERVPGGPVFGPVAVVSAAGADDVWAAANASGDGGPAWPDTVLVHWDGRGWRRVQPPPRIFLALNDLLVTGPDQLWLAAFRANGDAYGGGAREQLTGTRWQETDTDQFVVTALADDHAGGLWGVGLAGSYPDGLGFPTVYRPLVERARCA